MKKSVQCDFTQNLRLANICNYNLLPSEMIRARRTLYLSGLLYDKGIASQIVQAQKVGAEIQNSIYVVQPILDKLFQHVRERHCSQNNMQFLLFRAFSFEYGETFTPLLPFSNSQKQSRQFEENAHLPNEAAEGGAASSTHPILLRLRKVF